jgi:hypothetical protein
MIEISSPTRDHVQRLFSREQWSLVEELLRTRCGDNLPFVESDAKGLAQRIRFAVLKLSGGDLDRLYQAVDEAAVDWRDILMAAGFGNDARAHLRWKPH